MSLLTFVIFYVLPSADPAQLRAGPQPNPSSSRRSATTSASTTRATRSTGDYMKRLVLHFDFGYSYQNNTAVKDADLRPAAGDDLAGGRRA